MIGNTKTPCQLIVFIAICCILFIPLRISAQSDCSLDAGEDIEIFEPEPIALNATAVNIDDYRWGTYGDGYFLDDRALSTHYIPGSQDLQNGAVTIYIQNGQPDLPNDDYVDHYTVKDGEWDDDAIWNNGEAPPQNINGLTIVINHDIVVTSGIIKLNHGAQLYVNNADFYMYPNRSFIIQDASVFFYGGKFQQLNHIGGPGNGSAQGHLTLTKKESKLIMKGTEVRVSGNFHNNGTRILENVLLFVDRHYQNNGTDILKNVCARIAYEQPVLGQGPGNIHNSASAEYMYLENSTMYTYNGNFVNNSKVSGKFNALRIEDGQLVNTGDWEATIDAFCADHGANGNYAETLPDMDCEAADAAVGNCDATGCSAAYDELFILLHVEEEDTNDVEIEIPGDIGEDNDGGPVKGNDDDDGPGWPFGTGGDRHSFTLEAWPNPVQRSGRVHLSLNYDGAAGEDGMNSGGVLRLLSLNGAVLYEAVQEADSPFDLSAVPQIVSGIYLLEYRNSRGRTHAKIIVTE